MIRQGRARLVSRPTQQNQAAALGSKCPCAQEEVKRQRSEGRACVNCRERTVRACENQIGGKTTEALWGNAKNERAPIGRPWPSGLVDVGSPASTGQSLASRERRDGKVLGAAQRSKSHLMEAGIQSTPVRSSSGRGGQDGMPKKGRSRFRSKEEDAADAPAADPPIRRTVCPASGWPGHARPAETAESLRALRRPASLATSLRGGTVLKQILSSGDGLTQR